MLTISQIGLVFDILGTILLLAFGLPSKIQSTEGYYRITEGVSDEDLIKIEAKNKKVKLWAKVGVICILIGFVLQFFGGFPNKPR
jgi:hypothetical protein